MSRQIQIRRGTATEHSTFTGAVGEITMDTTNKTLRVHDGETAGGIPLAKQSEIPAPYTMPENYDFVVETQAPTAQNNYTWYRKYKSGWVEQGGTITIARQSANTGLTTTVNLPVTMGDANYYVASLTFIDDGGSTTGLRNHANERTTTTLKIKTWSTTSISNSYTAAWKIEGYCE